MDQVVGRGVAVHYPLLFVQTGSDSPWKLSRKSCQRLAIDLGDRQYPAAARRNEDFVGRPQSGCRQWRDLQRNAERAAQFDGGAQRDPFENTALGRLDHAVFHGEDIKARPFGNVAFCIDHAAGVVAVVVGVE